MRKKSKDKVRIVKKWLWLRRLCHVVELEVDHRHCKDYGSTDFGKGMGTYCQEGRWSGWEWRESHLGKEFHPEKEINKIGINLSWQYLHQKYQLQLTAKDEVRMSHTLCCLSRFTAITSCFKISSLRVRSSSFGWSFISWVSQSIRCLETNN